MKITDFFDKQVFQIWRSAIKWSLLIVICSFVPILIWSAYRDLVKGEGLYDAVRFGGTTTVQVYLTLKPSFVKVHFDSEEPLTEIPSVEREGQTLLHVATSHRQLEVMRILLGHGADVNASDHNGCTPLHFAAVGRESLSTVKILVAAGADINAKSKNETSPLQLAASCPGDLETVKFLVEAGAEVNEVNKFGYAPLDLACTDLIVQFLRSHGAKSAKELEVLKNNQK